MKYCHHCAEPITLHVPPGDNKPRYCCLQCDLVFYQNPKNVVGTLPIYEGKVLLCKRAIEPRYGKWTLPAGFMENDETALQGAIRETAEEAGAVVLPEDCSLYTLFNLPFINQVHVYFRTLLRSPEFKSGEESLEVALFSEEEIPWDELAFPVIRITLEQYFADRRSALYPVRMFDLHYSTERKLTTSLISSSAAPP
ncbi:MAG: NUDIX hydrolase [Gammaproteobacteria bacterium]|nr:NUDIX hydrolase [Gammaproteobacteria bacterium]MDP2140536.1 NUDIX hydrolase [Gammaproteobacteria bacterium]MDP2347305.1 NUDIX hydrolase [Gammaproteobacteria bacterium]